MSTDIVDKEMKELRNARWTKAFKKHSQDSMNFSDSINSEVDSRDTMNRKATIVVGFCRLMSHDLLFSYSMSNTST